MFPIAASNLGLGILDTFNVILACLPLQQFSFHDSFNFITFHDIFNMPQNICNDTAAIGGRFLAHLKD
jgi:hypothetical protein